MNYDAVAVLMKRDGMTREEAQELVDETMEEIMQAFEDDFFDPEEIWMDNTGLELDYMLARMGL